jgi:hypothetical protein
MIIHNEKLIPKYFKVDLENEFEYLFFYNFLYFDSFI